LESLWFDQQSAVFTNLYPTFTKESIQKLSCKKECHHKPCVAMYAAGLL